MLFEYFVGKISLLLILLRSVSWSKKFNPEGLPTVIWWTDLLYPHEGGSTEIKCPHGGRCVSSPRRRKKSNYLSAPTAFLFYGTDFSGANLPLPRLPNHLWALLHEESPMNNYVFSHRTGIELFNTTATFSRFSDWPLSLQHLPSLEYLDRPPVSYKEKDRLRREEGLAPVLYLQSHCGVASDRDSYVKELMRFIKVDSYGSCLHNRDLPLHLQSTDTHNDQQLFSFIARYKFHLAFENAICDDYVTEKLWRALHVGSVPIYKGSPSVRDWAPSQTSIIVANDFGSPEELAQFLVELDRNESLYTQYLGFKEEGVSNDLLKKTMLEREWGVNDPTQTDFIRGFECYVCDKVCDKIPKGNQPSMAHMHCPQPHPALAPQLAPTEGSMPRMWPTEESPPNTCDSPIAENGNCPVSKEPSPDEWSLQDWIESYFFAYDEARAIELMIRNGENDSSRFTEYITKLKYPN